ncbi:MAG: fimbrial protein [Iodobacter sp.]
MRNIVTAVMIGLSLYSVTATAATVDFSGTVLARTCTVANATTTVAMPTVDLALLKTKDVQAGVRAPIQIDLTGCPPGLNNASLTFTGRGIDYATGGLKNSADAAGAATGVQVMLMNSRLETIHIPTGTNMRPEPIVNGLASIFIMADYIAISDTVTPGEVKGTVEYTLVYP